MKNILILFLCIVLQLSVRGQQQPLSSLFDWNTHNLNAAYASLQDSSFVRASFRKQWTSFSAAPTTLNASGFGQMGKNSGFTALVMRDQMGGAFTSNLASVAYSRKVRLAKDFNLGLGLAGVFNQFSFEADKVELLQQEDPSFLAGSKSSGVDASFGVMLQGRGFSFGIGGQQLFQSKLNNFNNTQGAYNTLGRYYFIHGSYHWRLSQNIGAISSAMVKSNGISAEQYEVQTVFKFNQLIGVGLNHRINQGPALLFQLSQDNLYFAYAYDLPTGVLGEYHSGSHEIVLGFCIKGKNDLKDSDQDGVPDKKDQCPELKGFYENKGCPWPDTDGDGITDNIDKCPNTKGNVENNGCPELDSDGDGVADTSDDCPLTKGELENAGCPIVTESQKGVIEKAITTLEFESGKSVILKSSYPALDILALMLMEKTDWSLQLAGHTDDVGESAENMTLSKSRAEAVAAYLVAKGVQARQIEVLFFGENSPIADNTSEEGRKLNRRVEMKFIFK